MARDLGIANAALDAFAFGQAGLPPETLKALATHLFGGLVELLPFRQHGHLRCARSSRETR